MRRRAHFLIFGALTAITAVMVYTLSGDALGGASAASASPGPTRTPDPVTEPGGAGSRATTDAVPKTVQQLAPTQPGLQREIDRVAAQRTAPEAPPVASEDPTAGDREASELAQRCEAKISGEPVDTAWSHARNKQFSAFFARPLLAGTRPKAVDCRTTMCRIELTHRSNADRARFIQSFGDLAGPKGMVFAHIATADDLDIVVYVTRDGISLP